MIHKSASPITGYVRIVFELPADLWADRVFVTGDFNQWNESGIPMTARRDGAWQATLDLPAGTQHEFRYIVDGEWRSDYNADGCADNAHGSNNSIVIAEYCDDIAASESGAAADADSDKTPLTGVRSYLLDKWLANRRELDSAA